MFMGFNGEDLGQIEDGEHIVKHIFIVMSLGWFHAFFAE